MAETIRDYLVVAEHSREIVNPSNLRVDEIFAQPPLFAGFDELKTYYEEITTSEKQSAIDAQATRLWRTIYKDLLFRNHMVQWDRTVTELDPVHSGLVDIFVSTRAGTFQLEGFNVPSFYDRPEFDRAIPPQDHIGLMTGPRAEWISRHPKKLEVNVIALQGMIAARSVRRPDAGPVLFENREAPVRSLEVVSGFVAAALFPVCNAP